MELVKKVDDSICVKDMNDGELGVITDWDTDTAIIGKIVQRYQNSLIMLGKHSNHSWHNLFLPDNFAWTSNRVQILKPDTLLKV